MKKLIIFLGKFDIVLKIRKFNYIKLLIIIIKIFIFFLKKAYFIFLLNNFKILFFNLFYDLKYKENYFLKKF